MTAGLVMGIMLIPFVSSLSDDIINAVPQAMRDGSYGLGATQSETIKQVILPAALPGIVGAILLAASRAIGETMIVVMGAGAAAAAQPQPVRGDDDGDREDRQPADRRHRVCQPRDAGGLRARPDAVSSSRSGSTFWPSTSCANTGSSTNDRLPADHSAASRRNRTLAIEGWRAHPQTQCG
jgi:hypothetical protein